MNPPAFTAVPPDVADRTGISIDPAGQSVTLSLPGLRAQSETGRTDTPVAATHTLPLSIAGASDGVTIRFTIDGYAQTNDNGRGYTILGVNGQTAVRRFGEDADDQFSLALRFSGRLTTRCDITVALVAEADTANPYSAAHLSVTYLNALILGQGEALP
ncbi:hypothetical protein [Kineosporia sp. A_224]|uniref:hypothetical protein n=1 Tax=Kineosporia sp. A_224 TaxID=1962180 RepID=UPI000B4B69E9|nr:hypothetical protein [Kineosporia sp. A_224]